MKAQTHSVQGIPPALVRIILVAIPVLAGCYYWSGLYAPAAGADARNPAAVSARLQPVATVALESSPRR